MNADDERLANLRERAWQSIKGDSPSWGDIDFLIAQVERLTAERDAQDEHEWRVHRREAPRDAAREHVLKLKLHETWRDADG